MIKNRFILLGLKGLPLAKMTLPSVHFTAFSNEHSALSVGFERGKMIGLSLQNEFIVSMAD